MRRSRSALAGVALAGVVLATAWAAPAVGAISALEIIRSSRERVKADSILSRSRMVIASKDGGLAERVVEQATAKTGGADKTVIIFQKPASVAGTRFLTIENPGKAADRWIFLPALGKVRRLSSGEGSGAFMGTDLSYDDISSAERDAEADEHSLRGEETAAGAECWVVESRPKDPDYQYSKMVSWIDKASRIALKLELYDRKGELVKVLEVIKVEDRQGRPTPTVTRMSTVKARTSTTIYVDAIKYDDQVPPGLFTTKFLETGRP